MSKGKAKKTAIPKGAKVRILITAGLMESNAGCRFVDKCEPGTVGTYDVPLNRGWHAIKVGSLMAPLAADQFEVITEGEVSK